MHKDKKLMELMEAGEQIVLSVKVIKYTGQNKKLQRVIVLPKFDSPIGHH